MLARVEITPEQLQAAWQHRRRGDWPDTFDGSMAVPLLAALVRAEAVRHRVAVRRAEVAAAAWDAFRPYIAPAPRAPATAAPLRQPLDRKRLAAGERDDD